MTTTNTNHHKAPARKDRRQNQRSNNTHTAAPRRSAQEFCTHPPRGWTAETLELDNDPEARKRLRLLVLKGEYGWRVLPFTTIRVMKKTTTSDGSTIEVADDMDLLPPNPVEQAIEVNLFRENPLQVLVETLADYHMRQAELPPPHKRPLVQHLDEDKLRKVAMQLRSDERERVHQREEEDMAKAKPVKSSAKDLCFMLLLG